MGYILWLYSWVWTRGTFFLCARLWTSLKDTFSILHSHGLLCGFSASAVAQIDILHSGRRCLRLFQDDCKEAPGFRCQGRNKCMLQNDRGLDSEPPSLSSFGDRQLNQKPVSAVLAAVWHLLLQALRPVLSFPWLSATEKGRLASCSHALLSSIFHFKYCTQTKSVTHVMYSMVTSHTDIMTIFLI